MTPGHPSAHSPSTAAVPRQAAEKPAWRWFKRIASLLFFAAVVSVVASQARSIEWGQVLTSLEGYPLTAAWGAAALAAISLLLYSCFDLLSRNYTGHHLSTGQVMTTTFVSYVFNLNFGSLLGAIATRYRLYSRLGLEPGVITRILTFSMLTNWTGYLLLAGLVFSIQPPALPEDWRIDSGQLRLIGFALLAVALAYVAACAFLKRKVFFVRGHEIDLPTGRIACLQVAMGAANWMLMSGIVFILLQHRIELSAVISVLLLAAIAGVITHIPANLGVLEAIFVALLSHKMPAHEIVAALVAYRVVYNLAPLGIAAIVYLVLELRARKRASTAPQQARPATSMSAGS